MRPTWEILKAKFRRFTIHVAKIFTTTKHLLGTHVPFRIFKSQFHICEPTCEILKAKFRKFISQLVKIFAAVKHLLGTRVPFLHFKNQFRSYENTNRRLNVYLNLWFSHFSFHTAISTCEKALQVAKPKNLRGSPPNEAQKSCVWRGPFRAPQCTLWNTNLSISAMTKMRGAQTESPSAQNTRPRASPTRESMSEAPQASTIHLLRVECHLVHLSASTRRGDRPLHLGQAICALRNQFIALLQRKPEFQAQESHQHLHSLGRLL